MRSFLSRLAAAALVVALGPPQAVMAQSESEPESGSRMLEEIVVTATRRDESMQDVPISLSVLTDE
ncbi:MAG: hypothetical protein OXM56_00105, partial [Gammaproteobacteria bacterium]|nr:hypothetical protein [Gammaproteobacteria bacterium]